MWINIKIVFEENILTNSNMVTKEAAYKKISELVERFEEQYASYKNSDYNETLTRRDFIDPFFKALGWDMDNEQGYAEAFRDVIHEEKVISGGASEAPDYSFRIGGNKRLFFVEAKRPSVIIKDDIHPAYQVRRYGWNAKLSISIVTDFEEFAIYDCTKKPKHTDKASVARVKYLTFRDYLKEFDFLWNTFAKESVLKGSFDKFVQGSANKRGTATVDKEFLLSLDSWRTYLATSISRENKELDEDEINFVVQQTIDRIIFLRIAEDRNVEPYGNLKTAIQQGNFYQNLFNIFKEADEKYNSGLFDFKKDLISKNIKVDNKVIKTIITELYYPESPYEFSVLAVEILGSAYEQFLGKVIRITPAHHAKIEEKPEVRKAGGVYYTPQYIVEYIVKNTVGKLIEGKTPKEISKVKIVDPACGSGSFLIGAYQYLLDYHKNYYSNNGKPSKGKKEDTLTPEGHLTTAAKKRILLNNIYGVDIDVNAVEVTKLSLLLKCMEGETKASIAHQLSMFHERVLPTLENNIKSGNSLVSTDIYENILFEVDKKTKPFDWEKEFPEVFVERTEEPDPKEELKRIARQAKAHAEKALEYSTVLSEKLETVFEPQVNYGKTNKGGFDVVIGNPPYGFQISEDQQKYFEKRYKHQDYQKDFYLLFLERYEYLLKEKGILGVIISNTWLQSITLKKIRAYLLNNYEWDKILLLPKKVFNAIVDTHVLVFQKEKPRKDHSFLIEILRDNDINLSHALIQSEIAPNGDPINISIDKPTKDIYEKICRNAKKLFELATVYNGVKPFEKGKGNPPQTQKTMDEKPFVVKGKKPDKNWSALIRGSLINRYINLWNNDYWILYGHWLAAPRNPKIFQAEEKIMIRQTGDSLIATIIPGGFIGRDNLHIIIPSPGINIKFLLGVINSKLMDFVYTNINPEKGEALAQVKKKHVEILPIKEINTKVDKDVLLQSEIIKLVDQLLKLHEEKVNTKLQSEIEQIQRHIDFCEDQINIKVYELYNLTFDEIKIVKGNIS